MKKFRFLLFLVTAVLLCPAIAPANKSTAASFSFAKKYSSLSVGSSVTYRVKKLKNAQTVKFSVSDTSLASIQKKKGKLTAIGAGTLTVKAKIYNKKKKKICTLKDKITLKDTAANASSDSSAANTVSTGETEDYDDNTEQAASSSLLTNASFQIKNTINPYNFTLTLSCSRILLEEEVTDSTLTMLPQSDQSPKLTADFTALSSNGKIVTYTFNSSSQKKLCPGDSSMDGTYRLTSALFSEELPIAYRERLQGSTISGFILLSDGSPVPDAFVSLKTASGTTSCYSDENGHYEAFADDTPLSLTASKTGYETSAVTDLTVSKSGVSCENIVLRAASDTTASLKFYITDTDNTPLAGASVYLTAAEDSDTEEESDSAGNSCGADCLSKEDILCEGTTDENGTLLFTNTTLSESYTAPCSYFTMQPFLQLNEIRSYAPSADCDSTVLLSEHPLSLSARYTFYVCAEGDIKSTSYASQKITFSLADLSTNHAAFHVSLSACGNLSLPSLFLSGEDISALSCCERLTLSFFQEGQTQSFFEYPIEKSAFSQTENGLMLAPFSLENSLADGNYFVQFKGFSSTSSLLFSSPILAVSVENACLSFDAMETDSTSSAQTIPLQSPLYGRFLLYGDFSLETPLAAQAALYQKAGDAWFLVTTVSSDFFTEGISNYATANLIVPELLSGQTYLLYFPQQTVSCAAFSFSVTEGIGVSEKKEEILYLAPLSKLLCSSDTSACDFPSVEKESKTIFYSQAVSVSQSFVRTCSTYPNCVAAFYQADGTLLTTALIDSPAVQSAGFSAESLLSDTDAAIVDIYVNHALLVTSQSSYL